MQHLTLLGSFSFIHIRGSLDNQSWLHIFRSHYLVQNAVAHNLRWRFPIINVSIDFHLFHHLSNAHTQCEDEFGYSCIYAACISFTISLTMARQLIKMCNVIMLIFYPGLPYTIIPSSYDKVEEFVDILGEEPEAFFTCISPFPLYKTI